MKVRRYEVTEPSFYIELISELMRSGSLTLVFMLDYFCGIVFVCLGLSVFIKGTKTGLAPVMLGGLFVFVCGIMTMTIPMTIEVFSPIDAANMLERELRGRIIPGIEKGDCTETSSDEYCKRLITEFYEIQDAFLDQEVLEALGAEDDKVMSMFEDVRQLISD